MASFVVRIKDLHAGGTDFDFPVEVEWLRSALADCDLKPTPATSTGSAGWFRARLTKTGANILVQGEAHVAVEASCVRCLSNSPLLLAPRFEVLFTPKPTAGKAPHAGGAKASRPPKAFVAKGEKTVDAVEPDGHDRGGRGAEDEDDDDFGVDRFEGDLLCLDDLLREQVLLEAPMNPVCSSSCEGIHIDRAPHPLGAGAAAIDPRLTPLLKLVVQKKE